MPHRVDLHRVMLVEVLATSRDEWYSCGPGQLPGQVLAAVVADSAQHLVAMWQQLPEGEPRRCFFPRYGMRIWDDEGDITDTVLCFSCHLGSIRQLDKTEPFAFDADHPISQELLAHLKSHDPNATTARPS